MLHQRLGLGDRLPQRDAPLELSRHVGRRREGGERVMNYPQHGIDQGGLQAPPEHDIPAYGFVELGRSLVSSGNCLR